jgi:Cell division protein 48 (CDC48), N-terminal domain
MPSNSDEGDSSNNNKNSGRATRETPKAISLKVAEAEQRDVGRKIARVDPQVAEQLNITSGDALELTSLGKKNYCSKLAS